MGSEGRRRIEQSLGWPHQAEHYRSVYDRLLAPAALRPVVVDLVAAATATPDEPPAAVPDADAGVESLVAR